MANDLMDVIACCKNPEKWRDDILKELFSLEKKLRENIRCQTTCSTLTNCCRDTKIKTYKAILGE